MTRRRRWIVAGAAGAALAAGVVAVAAARDDDGDDPFCEAFGALLVGPLADPGTDAADPAVLEAAVDETRGLLAALVALAPTEQATEVAEALAAEYEAAFAVVAAYGYDLARVAAEATPDEQAVLDAFGETAATAGEDDPFDDLEAVVADRCAPDVSLTTP